MRIASTMRALRSVSLARAAIYVILHNVGALSFRRDFGSEREEKKPPYLSSFLREFYIVTFPALCRSTL